MNHMSCILLCLTSFAHHYTCEIHPHCSKSLFFFIVFFSFIVSIHLPKFVYTFPSVGLQFWILHFISLICLSTFMPIAHCIDNYSFIEFTKSSNYVHPQDCLHYFRPFAFPFICQKKLVIFHLLKHHVSLIVIAFTL